MLNNIVLGGGAPAAPLTQIYTITSFYTSKNKLTEWFTFTSKITEFLTPKSKNTEWLTIKDITYSTITNWNTSIEKLTSILTSVQTSFVTSRLTEITAERQSARLTSRLTLKPTCWLTHRITQNPSGDHVITEWSTCSLTLKETSWPTSVTVKYLTTKLTEYYAERATDKFTDIPTITTWLTSRSTDYVVPEERLTSKATITMAPTSRSTLTEFSTSRITTTTWQTSRPTLITELTI